MADDLVSIEVAWCVVCRTDCTVEVIHLAEDPAPVALCVDCGSGVDPWILPLQRRTARGSTRRAS